jgi:hypothetical protein
VANRPNAIPAVRCSATSRRTGSRCGQWARVGTTVCRFHGGGAPQVVKKADMNLVLAELLAADPRPLHEVLRDAVHVNDAVMTELRLSVQGGELDADTVARLVQSAERAGKLSRLAIDVGVHERIASSYARHVDVEVAACTGALLAVLDSLLDATVPDSVQRLALRRWAVDGLVGYLTSVEVGSEPPSLPAVPAVGPRDELPGVVVPDVPFAVRDPVQPEADEDPAEVDALEQRLTALRAIHARVGG